MTANPGSMRNDLSVFLGARRQSRTSPFLFSLGLSVSVLLGVACTEVAEIPGESVVHADDGDPDAAAERPREGAIGEYLDGIEGPPAGLPAASEARALPSHLDAFYRRRAWEPAWFERGWIGGQKLVPEATALVEIARRAEEEGKVRSGSLGLDDLGRRLESLERSPTAKVLAETDAALTWTALHLLSQLAYGPVLPQEAGIRWDVAVREVELARALDEALGDELEDIETRVAPDHPRYQRLVEARDRYRSIVENGGWPRVPKGDVLEVGQEGEAARIRALRHRLAAEGFSPGDGVDGPPVYTAELAASVKRFQSTRTLDQDGKLGPETQEELNVPAEVRLRQIELNLTRWRWVPEQVFRDAIVVNIPGYHLWRYADGEPRLDMGVVVGKPDWPTPVFSDEVEYMVLNPAWNVPVSIVRDEILPKLRENPAYLEENDMVLLEGWGEEARVVDSRRLVELASGDGGGLHLQQRPGPSNPLGTIKFMFPNDDNIYLHDTAARALFGEADRNLSHGCVRVSRPYDLAADLMREKGWSPRDVRSRIAGQGEEENVSLPEKVPVHLLYWTAEVRPEGDLHFYEDIYGIDRAQEKALRS